jgi:hypothetical protein
LWFFGGNICSGDHDEVVLVMLVVGVVEMGMVVKVEIAVFMVVVLVVLVVQGVVFGVEIMFVSPVHHTS